MHVGQRVREVVEEFAAPPAEARSLVDSVLRSREQAQDGSKVSRGSAASKCASSAARVSEAQNFGVEAPNHEVTRSDVVRPAGPAAESFRKSRPLAPRTTPRCPPRTSYRPRRAEETMGARSAWTTIFSQRAVLSRTERVRVRGCPTRLRRARRLRVRNRRASPEAFSSRVLRAALRAHAKHRACVQSRRATSLDRS